MVGKHGPDATTDEKTTHFGEQLSKSEANALAGRTIQGAEQSGEVAYVGNRKIHINEETGWFSSLGTNGEDKNVVVTTPLSQIGNPELKASAIAELMSPKMLATMAAAELIYGNETSPAEVLEKVEVHVIISMYPRK